MSGARGGLAARALPARLRPALLLPALLLPALVAACAISHRDEIRMGQDYDRQIEAELPVVHDAALDAYLTRLGDTLARPADARGLAWHFRLIDRAEVNAFAVPGGYVYVTRGLVERTGTESQLAGVLAHEIAHVVRRHAVKRMEAAQRANLGVGLVCVLSGVCESEVARVGIELGGAAVFAQYSREDEAEADADAVRIVMGGGISPRGIPELFAALLAERKERPAGVAAWFATHPAEEDRLARARQAVAALDAAALDRLTEDTPAFQRFRAAVRARPAAGRTAGGG
jgi:predicted Zn-dependent protease